MKNLTLVVAMTLIALLATTDAMAQGRGRGGRMGGGFGGRGGGGQVNKIALLSVDAIAQELGLSEDQKSQAASLQEDQRGQRGQRGERPNFRDMSEEDRQAWRDERQAQAQERRKETDSKLAEILSSEQVTRLNQIVIQLQGPAALLTEPVQKSLSLSEETVAELRETSQSAGQAMREEMRGIFGGGDREAAMEKMQELRKQYGEKLLSILSEDQQKAFADLQGDKLEVSQQDLMVAMRGNRGGRGQRGQRGDRGPRNGQEGRPELE